MNWQDEIISNQSHIKYEVYMCVCIYIIYIYILYIYISKKIIFCHKNLCH